MTRSPLGLVLTVVGHTLIHKLEPKVRAGLGILGQVPVLMIVQLIRAVFFPDTLTQFVVLGVGALAALTMFIARVRRVFWNFVIATTGESHDLTPVLRLSFWLLGRARHL